MAVIHRDEVKATTIKCSQIKLYLTYFSVIVYHHFDLLSVH